MHGELSRVRRGLSVSRRRTPHRCVVGQKQRCLGGERVRQMSPGKPRQIWIPSWRLWSTHNSTHKPAPTGSRRHAAPDRQRLDSNDATIARCDEAAHSLIPLSRCTQAQPQHQGCPIDKQILVDMLTSCSAPPCGSHPFLHTQTDQPPVDGITGREARQHGELHRKPKLGARNFRDAPIGRSVP